MGGEISKRNDDLDAADANFPWILSTYQPNIDNLSLKFSNEYQVYTNKLEKLKCLGVPPAPAISNISYNMKTVADVASVAESVDICINKSVGWVVKELLDKARTNCLDDSNGEKQLTDADKVRVIFYWLTCQNVKHRPYELSVNPLSMCYQLKSLQDKKSTYAVLFALMCHYAGLCCVIIKGVVKGDRYHWGKVLGPRHVREWNAVLVDDEWRLVDPFWGVAVSPNEQDLSQTTDWFYLFPNPEELKYSHLPDTPVWQLLHNKITKEQFEEQVCLKRRFFEMEMGVISHSHAHIVDSTGEVEILLQLNANNADEQEFRCIVKSLTESQKWKEVELPFEDLQLDFIHKHTDENETPDEEDEAALRVVPARQDTIDATSHLALSVKVRFPKKGQYQLEIVGKSGNNHSSLNWMHDYDWVVVYYVFAEQVPANSEFFPSMKNIGWGPNKYLKECGLEALSHKNGQINCMIGQSMNIKFKVLGPTRNVTLRFELTRTESNRSRIEEGGIAAHTNSDIDEYDEVNDVDSSRELFKPFVENGQMVVNIPLLVESEGQHVLKVSATLNTEDKGAVIWYMIKSESDLRETLTEKINEVVRKLKSAIESREITELESSLNFTRVQAVRHRTEVIPCYNEANTLYRNLKREIEYLRSIPTINAKVVMVLKSFRNPDPVIVSVFRGTFLLLGEEREDLIDWSCIRSKITLIGKSNLNRRLKEFDVNAVTAERIDEVKHEGFENLDLIAVVQVSCHAAAFAKWIKLVLARYEEVQASQ